MRHFLIVALASITTVALSATDGDAPTRGTIENSVFAPSPPAGCGVLRCDIELVAVASLSEAQQPRVLPESSPWVVRDRHGRFFVRARAYRQVAVFDPTGKFLSMVGTGEHRLIGSLVIGPDGVLYLHDYALRRLTAVAPNLSTLRTVPMAFAPAFVRADGTFIVAEHVRTPKLIGYPIHHTDAFGKVLRSFGTLTPEYRPDLRLLVDRIVAPSIDGTVWAAAPGRYALERWDPVKGTRVAEVRPRSGWFVESGALPASERTRPTPLLQAVWELDGLIWVLIRDADSKWRPPVVEVSERAFDLQIYNATHDWIIEVIDPASGNVLASKRYDAAIWTRASSDVLVTYRLTSAGERGALEVWRPSLKRR